MSVNVDINKYKVVTFDVFDTAILRAFNVPVDVFKYIEIKYNLIGFATDRISRECQVRQDLSHKKDITIYDIYKDFHYDINIEISVEKKICIPHLGIYNLYLQCLEKGKKVFFISDSYLTKEIIEEILYKNGYDQYEELYVSCEDNLLKGDGSRFDSFLQYVSVKPDKMLHIGDNYIADYLRPQDYGIDTFLCRQKDHFYKHDDFISSKIDYLLDDKTLGLSFVTSLYHYWSIQNNSSSDYWYKFGFFYGGILISSFCYYINKTIKEREFKCDKLFFLARDGQIVKAVYEMLFTDLDLKYIFASRRCMVLPSITHLDPDKNNDVLLEQFCASGEVQDIIDRFQYEGLDDFKAYLVKLFSNNSHVTQKEIYQGLCKYKHLFWNNIYKERAELISYLHSEGMFDQEDIVLIDVGWSGSIQSSLIKLINEIEKYTHNINGIYLGVMRHAKNKSAKSGFLFNNGVDFYEYLDLIELLTSSPDPTIVRVQKQGDTFIPVTFKANGNEQERRLASKSIQKGVLAFTSILKTVDINPLDFIKNDDFKRMFNSLNYFASGQDMAGLGNLKHATLIGNYYNKKVLPNMTCTSSMRPITPPAAVLTGNVIYRKTKMLLVLLYRGDFKYIKVKLLQILRNRFFRCL